MNKTYVHEERYRAIFERLLKVAEHSFQVPVPNSPILLNYLSFGAHFLQESRLIAEVFILTF